MKKIVECVPNFSEGRRAEVIDSIRLAASSVSGVRVLDCESDAYHNRMVLTIVGPPEQIKEAALASAKKAVELIDLTKHTGEHPRMGAVDVVPFVPIRGITMDECVELANSFANDFSLICDVPVFLYEYAARSEARRNLAAVREGEFEGLRELIGKDPNRIPDYGPDKIHPTAGATAVGARQVLIAYNVNLKSNDLTIAKRIASKIREKNGGLPAVKALGFALCEKNLVQVSMNLTDYKKTSMHTAFAEIDRLAQEAGVAIAESEIVGLVPLEAIGLASMYFMKLRNFNMSQIIENRLTEDLSDSYSESSLDDFSDALASSSAIPGGGSAAALAGANAASLVAKVCRVSIGKKGYEKDEPNLKAALAEALDLKIELLKLVDEDSKSYEQVAIALKLPKNTEEERSERMRKIETALKIATMTPVKTLEFSQKVKRLADTVVTMGNKNARSDCETASYLAEAAMKGSLSNILLNLDGLKNDEDFARSVRERIKPFNI